MEGVINPNALAELYDEDMWIYPELLKAHQENDIAVMEAYGFVNKEKKNGNKYYTDSEIIEGLMRMYQELITK